MPRLFYTVGQRDGSFVPFFPKKDILGQKNRPFVPVFEKMITFAYQNNLKR